MRSAGSGLRRLLGVSLVAVALLVLTGLDGRLESVLLDASPDWLTDATTAF